MQENEKKTQAERFAEILLELKPNVSAQDRTDATTDVNISKASIAKYLAGDVMDLDTAASLISFFKERIAKREKSIA